MIFEDFKQGDYLCVKLSDFNKYYFVNGITDELCILNDITTGTTCYFLSGIFKNIYIYVIFDSIAEMKAAYAEDFI